MRTVLVAILVHHPFQHLPPAIIIKVGVDIGQGDTVGIQETLEQQVVFQGINLRDAQAVGHNRPGCRPTSRSHHHAQFLSGRTNKVGYNQEITRKTHGLHHMKLKAYAVVHLLGQRVAIPRLGTLIGKMLQIVGLKLDAIHLLIATQMVYPLLRVFLRHGIFAILIGGKLTKKVFLRKLLFPILFLSKRFGNGEVGHNGVVVDGIDFHLIKNLEGIRHRFGHIAEDAVHLFAGLKPLLLGIKHARGVVKVFPRRETQQVIVSLGVLFVHKVNVIGAHHLNAVLLSQAENRLIGALLHGIGLTVGPNGGVFHLVALYLQVVIVAKNSLVPLYRFPGSGHVAGNDFAWHLTGQASRTNNEVFMIFLQFLTVGTRPHVIALFPGMAHQLDKVFVATVVFSQHDEVVTTHVAHVLDLVEPTAPSHVHLTTKDGLEGLLSVGLQLLVNRVGIVEKFLDAKHVAMVGDGQAAHPVGNSFINEPLHGRLTVENGIISMYV